MGSECLDDGDVEGEVSISEDPIVGSSLRHEVLSKLMFLDLCLSK